MGVDIDRLDVKIEADASDANKQLDETVAKLRQILAPLNEIMNSKAFVQLKEQSKEIDKSLTRISKDTKAAMQNVSASIEKASKPMQESVKKVSESLEEIQSRYKDLGKDFQFFGSAESAQKQIEKYSNALETAKLKKAELEATGKTEGKGYEDAIRSIQKYSNVIENLKKQFSEPEVPYVDISKLTQEEFDEWRETLPSAKKQTEEMADVVKEIGDQVREFTGEWGGIEIPPGFLKTENLIDRMKTHIQQMMNGMRIEGPIDVSALTDEEWDIFQKLKEEAHLSVESVKQSFDQVEEPIRESFALASESLRELDLTLANFASNAARVFEEPKSDIKSYIGAVDSLKIAFSWMGDGLSRAFEVDQSDVESYIGLTDSLKTAFSWMKDAFSRADDIKIAFAEMGDEIEKVAGDIADKFAEMKGRMENAFIQSGLKTYTSQYTELQNEITKTEKTLATLNAQLARSKETVKNFDKTTAYRKMQYDIAEATKELQRLRVEQDKLEMSGGATQWNFKGLSEGIQNFKKSLQPLGNALKNLDKRITSFVKKLRSIIFPAKSAKKSVDNFHSSLSGGLVTMLKYSLGIRKIGRAHV